MEAIGIVTVGVLAVVAIVGVAIILFMAGDFGSMKLSATDIAGYAQTAGWTGSDLVIAVAVALKESSGDPKAKGDTDLAPTNGPSIGLWQVNTGTKAHPELAGQDLTDPQTNANAAFRIYTAAHGFTPWSTYNAGIDADTLSAASAGVTEMQGNASDDQSA